MNPQTRRITIAGPAGPLECAIDEPAAGTPVRGVAVLSHPHPQHGGTMDNKVVQTLARAAVQCGWRAVRYNFRGVGGSGGQWDHGRGEVDDALAVIAAHRDAALPLALGGFSFGGYVTTQAVARLGAEAAPAHVVLVAPAVVNFDCPPVPAHTQLIHGETDDVVPLSAVLDWARPQTLPLTVVPGTGHFFHGQLSLLKQLIVGAWR